MSAIEVTNVQNGDIFVLQAQHVLTEPELARLKVEMNRLMERMSADWPTTIVLERGMKLSILRRPDKDDPAERWADMMLEVV